MPDGRDLAAEVDRLRAAGVSFRNDIVKGPAARRFCSMTLPAIRLSYSNRRRAESENCLAGDGPLRANDVLLFQREHDRSFDNHVDKPTHDRAANQARQNRNYFGR